MLYHSTRGTVAPISSAEAIKSGIAADGGLFVPEKLPSFKLSDIEAMVDRTYNERALAVLKGFLDDYTEKELNDCVYNAYNTIKFTSPEIAPLHKLNDNISVLELWHGPTCAFKDMALQILPHFMTNAMRKTGEECEIVILVATSGDTGKAALEGFKDVDGTKIIVFFPRGGVSEVQKMQMITQEGKNVYSVAVEGNFDDTQSGVKAIFTDAAMITSLKENNIKFSSANSINWGRLVPQIVYYFSAYADMVKSGEIKLGDKINFVVPTGNFGNILAGYYAKKMGLPVNKLVCASNENNVLTDFIHTGTYNKNREFKKTNSPSMDILISSNLERLLFEMTGHDGKQVSQWMKELKENGIYSVDEELQEEISKLFWADFTTEKETLTTIECIYKDYNYVVDTHTAVAVDVYDKYVISTGDMTKTVIVSTASPFKFNQSVAQAVLGEKKIAGMDEFTISHVLSKECDIPVPPSLKDLEKKEILHKRICDKNDMPDVVKDILKV